MKYLILRPILTILLVMFFTDCASIQEVNDPYSETYKMHMESIKRSREIAKGSPGAKYLSPQYIDQYKSTIQIKPSGSEGELRLMQPARSLRISKKYVSDKKGYTLSSNPKDNTWSRYNAKGYTLTLYGTYSDPHDILSSFIPEDANLIYTSKEGENDALMKGTLTVEEFLNFDFSKEIIHKYFGEGIKEAN